MKTDSLEGVFRDAFATLKAEIAGALAKSEPIELDEMCHGEFACKCAIPHVSVYDQFYCKDCGGRVPDDVETKATSEGVGWDYDYHEPLNPVPIGGNKITEGVANALNPFILTSFSPQRGIEIYVIKQTPEVWDILNRDRQWDIRERGFHYDSGDVDEYYVFPM